VPPGSSLTLTATVTPAQSGRIRMVVERFDPLAGYQFMRALHARAVNGRAVATFAPPSVGLYRARATFLGTKFAAGSETSWRHFSVQVPLKD
jgi:hypothetical protein